jgi:acetyl-CoA acetyltransferase
MPTAVIVSAARTAIGTLGGSLAQMPATKLGAIAVREAVRRAGVARRDAAAESAAALFSAFGLRPRVPPPLLAEVIVAFVDGLAVDAALAPEREPRVAFDVFWLSLLSLAE